MKLILLFSLVYIVVGCETLSPSQPNEVEGVASESGILLTNKTEKTIYYFVVGHHESARIRWAPTISKEIALLTGQFIEIARSVVDPNNEEDEVIVYWWHAISDNNTI